MEAAAALGTAAPLWVLPERGAIALGRVYGRLLGMFSPTARRAGMINLRRAYGPSLSHETARRWTREVFAGMGQSLAEAAQFIRRQRRGGRRQETAYVLEDPDLAARLRADPGPKVCVLSHLGSWEVAGLLLGLHAGARGTMIYRRVDNPLVEAFVSRFRRTSSGSLLEKRGATGEAVRRLREGRSVALLLDETGGHHGLFLDFFGRPASTLPTAALLALRTGATVVVAAAVRRRGSPLLARLAQLDPPDASRDPEAAVRELTARILGVLERWIREDPLQWRWVHWRWKHRPDGQEETYRREDLRAAFPEVFGGPAVSAPAAGQGRWA